MHNSGNASVDNTYGMTPEQASREFDVLRREATKLERHLEDRVARYQQVSIHVYILVLSICCCNYVEGAGQYVAITVPRGALGWNNRVLFYDPVLGGV